MCGIAGIVGGEGDYSSTVSSMLRAQAHRGPDGSGMVTFEGGGAAGAVRLALIDLSERGDQPIWSSDRRVAILYNGEVYNHVEERSRLTAKGYAFRSSTDTEVILALYLEYGLEFAQRLRCGAEQQWSARNLIEVPAVSRIALRRAVVMHGKRECRRQPMAWSAPWAANAKVDRPRIRRLAAWQVRSASGHAVPPRAELHEERITNGAT